MILPEARDARMVTIRRGGSLRDEHHQLLASWAADCAEHVLELAEVLVGPLRTPQSSPVNRPGDDGETEATG